MATTMPFLFVISVALVLIASILFWRRFRGEGIIDQSKLSQSVNYLDKITDIAGNHTQVAGALAGFSITVAVLIATFMNELVQQGSSPLGNLPVINAAALGLFIVSFFGYVATGITYSLVPEREGERQYVLFSIASVLYMFSVFVSFTALLILLTIIDAEFLIGPIAFFVAGGLVGAYMAVGIPIHDLLYVRRSLLFCVFLASVGIAGSMVSGTWSIGHSTLILVQAGMWFSVILLVVSFGLAMSMFLVEQLTGHRYLRSYTIVTLSAGVAVVVYNYLVTLTLIFYVVR